MGVEGVREVRGKKGEEVVTSLHYVSRGDVLVVIIIIYSTVKLV